MFVAHSSRTMAGAKRVVEDRPIDLRRRIEASPPRPRRITPVVRPPVMHEFSGKPTRETVRQRRRDLAERALEIDQETSTFMQVLPFDATATVAEIIAAVAARHGVAPKDILSRDRARFLVAVRRQALGAVRIAKPHLSLPTIGRLVGNRDHTSVIFALRKCGLPTCFKAASLSPAQSVR